MRLTENARDSRSDRLRWIMRRGEDFQDLQSPTFHPHAVGEGSAGIDGDAQRNGAWFLVMGADQDRSPVWVGIRVETSSCIA